MFKNVFFPLFKEKKSSDFTLLQVNFWFYRDSVVLMLRLSLGTKKHFNIIFFLLPQKGLEIVPRSQ